MNKSIFIVFAVLCATAYGYSESEETSNILLVPGNAVSGDAVSGDAIVQSDSVPAAENRQRRASFIAKIVKLGNKVLKTYVQSKADKLMQNKLAEQQNQGGMLIQPNVVTQYSGPAVNQMPKAEIVQVQSDDNTAVQSRQRRASRFFAKVRGIAKFGNKVLKSYVQAKTDKYLQQLSNRQSQGGMI